MMLKHRCVVQWASGARPETTRYVAVAKFASQTESEWVKDAWSVVIDFSSLPSQKEAESAATVSFLVPAAPEHFMTENSVFEVFEGAKKVADIVLTKV
jgi:hypothetical protein